MGRQGQATWHVAEERTYADFWFHAGTSGTGCHQARYWVPTSLPQGFPILTHWVLALLWEAGTEAVARGQLGRSARLQSFEATLPRGAPGGRCVRGSSAFVSRAFPSAYRRCCPRGGNTVCTRDSPSSPSVRETGTPQTTCVSAALWGTDTFINCDKNQILEKWEKKKNQTSLQGHETMTRLHRRQAPAGLRSSARLPLRGRAPGVPWGPGRLRLRPALGSGGQSPC